MKFWKKDLAAKYHAEGLSTAQASRLVSSTRDHRSTLLIAGLAFVAVGSLAYIGLQTITTPGEVKRYYSSAPPSGTAMQMMMALKVPHDREQENARLAILNDETGPMEIKSLEKVERLVNPNAIRPSRSTTPAAVAAADPVAEEIEVAAALPTPVLPEAEPVVEPVIEASVEPEVIEVAAVDTVPEPAATSCVDDLRAAASEATIFFDIGSTQITTDNILTLQRLGRMVSDCDGVKVQVAGHSDTTGNPRALWRPRRAAAACAWPRNPPHAPPRAQRGGQVGQAAHRA